MSKVKFTTTLDNELLEKAKIQAIKEKTSVAKIIEKLLTEYLDKGQSESSSDSSTAEPTET